jgi:hypothetical protein
MVLFIEILGYVVKCVNSRVCETISPQELVYLIKGETVELIFEASLVGGVLMKIFRKKK